jgi:hypothetical protein
VITSVVPRIGLGNSAPAWLVAAEHDQRGHLLAASLSSFALDFVSRPKVGGTHLNFFIAEQLAVLPPGTYDAPAPWNNNAVLYDWLTPRVLELTYTAWDLAPFARDLGYGGPPFRWDFERRFLLRCELDAAYFHLYELSRDDVDYIMDTFLVFKQRDNQRHREYRTKRVILEIYDHMACAAETGQIYQTLLDPPPVTLDLPTSEPTPSTVTPLHPRTQPEPERPALVRVAEEKATYEAKPSANRDPKPEPQANSATEAEPTEEVSSATSSPQHQAPEEPQDALFERPTPQTISLEDAALALHACVPDGEKVERHTLLLDAARKLGQTKLTRKVRRALNLALNAEHNAGRLRTDWERVWRPKKR